MAEVEFTDENFANDAEGSDKVVLIDFWAPWCGPCRMQGPIVDELANEVGDTYMIGKLNVDEAPQTATKYGVQSIPTIIILKGGKEVERLVGVQTKEELLSKLETHSS